MARTRNNATSTGKTDQNIQFDRIATPAALLTEIVQARDIGSLALLDDGSMYRLVSIITGPPTTGNWTALPGAGAELDVTVTPTTLTNANGGTVAINVASAVINLPAAPFDGLEFTFLDVSGSATNKTIGENGKTINSAAAPYVIVARDNGLVTLRFNATKDDWNVVGFNFGVATISALT